MNGNKQLNSKRYIQIHQVSLEEHWEDCQYLDMKSTEHLSLLNLTFKAEKKLSDEVLNMSDLEAAILVIVGQTKICVSSVFT